MHTHPSLERAKSYLDVQIGHASAMPGGIRKDIEGPFVTISRECGAGSPQLVEKLAERLNAEARDVSWTVFDQRIVEHVLRDEHLSPRLARFLPEDRISEITGSVGEIVGLHPNLWTLVQKTNRLLYRLAEKGNVILVGRGANFAAAKVAHGLHVRLVAPESIRIARIMEEHALSEREARSMMHKTDAARAHYVASVFDADVTDTYAYDLVLNTGRLSEAALIKAITSALQPQLEALAAQELS